MRSSFFTHQVMPGSKAGRDATPFRAIPIEQRDHDGGQLVGPAERELRALAITRLGKIGGHRDRDRQRDAGPRRRTASVARSAGLRVVAAGWDMKAFYLPRRPVRAPGAAGGSGRGAPRTVGAHGPAPALPARREGRGSREKDHALR